MREIGLRILGLVGISLLAVVSCTSSLDTPGSTTTEPDASVTSTTRPATTSTIPETDTSRWDADAVTWNREVVAPIGPAQLNDWYRDISAHPIGFIAVGVDHGPILERPGAWLTFDGEFWLPLEIPAHLEGRFTAVASDHGITVMLGYDTASGSGLIVRAFGESEPSKCHSAIRSSSSTWCRPSMVSSPLGARIRLRRRRRESHISRSMAWVGLGFRAVRWSRWLRR